VGLRGTSEHGFTINLPSRYSPHVPVLAGTDGLPAAIAVGPSASVFFNTSGLDFGASAVAAIAIEAG
jgi:hypothetical protein